MLWKENIDFKPGIYTHLELNLQSLRMSLLKHIPILFILNIENIFSIWVLTHIMSAYAILIQRKCIV